MQDAVTLLRKRFSLFVFGLGTYNVPIIFLGYKCSQHFAVVEGGHSGDM